jgi:hypothetical protein
VGSFFECYSKADAGGNIADEKYERILYGL